MANRRLSLDADGLLRTKEGQVLGRLKSLTIDLAEGVSVGTIGVGAYPLTEDNGDTANAQVSLIPEGVSGEIGGPSLVAQVWEHYQAVVPGGSRFTLDAKKTQVIRNALKVRPLTQVLDAIDGLAHSPHHLGQNDRRKRYLGIRYALVGIGAESNDERIDKMAEIGQSAASNSLTQVMATLPSDGRAMVLDRQREVRLSLETPGDETLLNRRCIAEEWFRVRFGLRAVWANGELRWEKA